ncbi:MAG: hypothetical protein JRJ87_19830 [Deltaproteobacteria bacterium]|nr:hypothetical protein [Deltaproteobacteria bacterium]
MKDEKLDQILGELPKERALEKFTEQVLTRLTDQKRSEQYPRKIVLGLALAGAILALFTAVFVWWWQASKKDEILGQIMALQAETQELRAALADIQLRTFQTQPVLYLGGNEQIDYVLDMKKYIQSRKTDSKRRVLPVNYSGGSL